MANSKSGPGEQFLLRDVLEKLGISQRSFARQMGRSLDWVGRIVRGSYSPSWRNAVAIARSLKVTMGVFHDNDPARLHFFQSPKVTEKPKTPPEGKPRRAKTASTDCVSKKGSDKAK